VVSREIRGQGSYFQLIGYFIDTKLVHDAIGFLAAKDRATVCVIFANPAPTFGGFFFHHELEEFSLALFCHGLRRFGAYTISRREHEGENGKILPLVGDDQQHA
jgi:hypothetical protein